ncbi:MAG: DUF362 domain-containing protein [Candidatus Hodarchaeales archaeon]
MAKNVFFSPAWLPNRTASDRSGSIIRKIRKIFENANFSEKINKRDLVCIKTNFGDPGNANVVRPVIYRTVADIIHKAGGKPFLAETTGHGYMNHKRSAAHYIDSATWHGLTIGSVRAPLILLDGFWGLDGVEVEVPNNIVLEKAWVARGLVGVDHVVSISHFKGHSPYTRGQSIAASLKNLGIGCTTKTGKYLAHFDPPLYVDEDKCDGCKRCLSKCPVPTAIEVSNGKARIDEELCLLCGHCKSLCPLKAIVPSGRHSEELLQKFIVDLSKATLEVVGKEKFTFLNSAYDIVTGCDCRPVNSVPLVPDVGFLLSSDPVAADRATLDLVNETSGIPGTEADQLDCVSPGKEKFGTCRLFEFCETAGLGSGDYELIKASPEKTSPLRL